MQAQAARTPELGGMVLQSPIASAGLVVFRESIARALADFDLFRNYEKIKLVQCRTLVIHGREDTMVPFDHALMLFPLLRDAHDPLWVDGAGHHDLPDVVCLEAVSDFIAYVEDRNMQRYGRARDDSVMPLVGEDRTLLGWVMSGLFW